MSELKPCHFCGGETFIVQHDIGNENWSKIYYSVKCSKCDEESLGSSSEKLAVDRWNESKFNINNKKWRALNREKCILYHEKIMMKSLNEYDKLIEEDKDFPWLTNEWKKRKISSKEFHKKLMKDRLQDDESDRVITDWSFFVMEIKDEMP